MARTEAMAPTGNGERGGARLTPVPRADRWRRSMLLTVTRRCNLRCTYCPTVKDGLPDLSVADARLAMRLFVRDYGGGELKLFGGEPTLVPDVVEAAIREAPPEVSVMLSTNGLGLDERLLGLIADHPRVTLTLSLDGEAVDHDAFRRPTGDTPPSHAIVTQLLPRLLALPRFVVTQTVAPHAAVRAGRNFRYLLGLGIRRFNLLPGYYLPWSATQLAALQEGFQEIGDVIAAAWARDERLYLRNLFIRAPTPFFNTGIVVDVDRRIYASNLILAARYDELREGRALGTLDAPPDPATLDAAARDASETLRSRLSPAVWSSTLAVDATLTALCNRLTPALLAHRRRRQSLRVAA